MRGNWLHTLLRDYGFVKADEIITMDQRATPQVLDIAAAPVLRDWRAADLSAVAAIDRAAFAAPWRYPLPVLERMIARAQVTCVAQLDAEIAAYLSASLDRGHAHIIRLAVTPAQKRQGIGSGLLSACAARLRHDGAVRVTLNTPASLDTLHFYRKHGFRALSDIADVFRYDL
jgi:ribosomal-protein-alanine N-acetyltransferase